ncbi:uncharacterized protein LOC126843329 [Adelges cooleyi]|uniref:uncharacterized protein LOC126843329 n=1 Tax=Adelges cooleyi TaxID=133065 RepID=UPI00217F70F0|nr:uncharacterized protein LOC126843329 [Adelges cooleyi]
MNFKNCILFLYLIVHLYTANAGICDNPSELARLYTKILDQGKGYQGVTKATVKQCIIQKNVINEFNISTRDENKILSSVWDTTMSQEEFITTITSRLTFCQLANIYNEFDTNCPVNKKAVQEYLLKRKDYYELNVDDIKVITKPLKDDGMSWDEFYILMVFKK